MLIRLLLATAFFLLGLGFTPLAAEESQSTDDDVATLSDVAVTEAGYRTTGTKSGLRPLEAPMSYEVYDGELLAWRQVDSINDALRYVPGITTESRATVTIFDQYTIRGFESYRNYYDGLPLQYNNLWNLVPQVDAFATESIEVLRGPTSVLYGSAPPGGMINQTAKMPRSTPELLLRARFGTDDMRELAVDSTGLLTGSVDYRLIALTRSRDGQQRTTEEERHTFAPSLTWQLRPETVLNISLYHQQDPEMVPSTPLPALGTLEPADYGRLAADAYAGDENWSGFDRDVTMLGYKLDHAFSPDFSFLQNFRYTDADAFQRNTYNQGLQADGRTLNRSAYFTDEEQQGFVIDNQLAWTIRSTGFTHRLLMGAEYQKLDSKVRYGDTLGTDTPAIDLGAPDYRLIDPAALPVDFYTERHDIDQSQLGVYLQDEIERGALTIVAGLRWDRYRSTDAADFVFDGFPYDDETRISQEETSGRLGAIYTLDNGLAPYFSYAESFEPTAGTDSLTGEAFKPTTASQVEAGLKFHTRDRRTELTLAAFDLRKKNVVVNTPDFLQFTQTGEVTSKGVELAWRQVVTEQLDFIAALTSMDVSVTKNELNPALVGNTPVWVAEQQASLWANYYATSDWQFSGGIRYVGESQLDALNTGEVPSYTLADLAVAYNLGLRYRLGLTVNNLFDERYVGACFDSSNCWMGAERSVQLSFYADY